MKDIKVDVLRTDGTREIHVLKQHGISKQIGALIHADCTDTVNLRDGRVLIVNDSGYEVGIGVHEGGITLKPIKALLPVNEEATKLYHAICRPGVTHQIVGDAVVAWDKDFA